ncbi:MAG: YitT family protein [Lachnospiraceae bacterium]|nr:YitT family protein [Lachnospiraceae bacterium]
MKFKPKEDLLRLAAVLAAAVLAGVCLKTFVKAAGLFPGGATGIALLIQGAVAKYAGIDIPYTPINLALNVIPIYIGFRYIGKKFTLYSMILIVVMGVVTDAVPAYPLTDEPLLLSIFGGIIFGFASCICFHFGATTGGSDFIAIFLSRRKNYDSFNVTLTISIIILVIAGMMFGWDKALYSIIYQYASTQVIHTFYRRYQQETLIIVTDHPNEVCEEIFRTSGHDATILHGEGAYKLQPKGVIYSVVNRDEYKSVINAVRKSDPGAFVNSVKTDFLRGRFYNRPED